MSDNVELYRDWVSSAGETSSREERLPTLTRWLEGAPAEHPWLHLLSDRSATMDPIGAALERILDGLESAQPERLPSKKKVFREDSGGYLNVRSELNVGYTLTETGTRFAFGGQGQPDYVCTLEGGSPGYVEVTTRARDDLRKLHDGLESRLRDHDILITLRVPRRLVIPQAVRRTIWDRIEEVVTTRASDWVGLPEIDGAALLGGPSLFGGPQVVLDIGSELGEHGESIERAMLTAIGEKAVQSAKGGWDPDTALVLDLSRLGVSWIRPDHVWGGRLESMGLNWDAIPFSTIAVVFSDLLRTGYHGACVWRPDLKGERALRVEGLRQALAF